MLAAYSRAGEFVTLTKKINRMHSGLNRRLDLCTI